MTERERHAPGGASEGPEKDLRGTVQGGTSAGSGAAVLPPWEEVFRAVSPEQQEELLDLARRQGILYAHQFPPIPNGTVTPSGHARQFLTRLLTGRTEGMKPLRVPPAPAGDQPLNDLQREAVARALETPDICLVQGGPGTGKSHVIAEIVTRAASRGDRVLLLAPRPAPLDRVLELVGGRDMVCAIRCLGREEGPETLSPAVRALTFAERARSFQEHSLECAARELEKAEERLARRRREEAVWPRLAELAARLAQLAGDQETCRKRRGAVAAAVESEAADAEQTLTDSSPFLAALAAAGRRRDQQLAALDQQLADTRRHIDEKRREKNVLVEQLDELRPLVQAKQQHRWWTGSWWWATIQGNVLERAAELEGQLEHAAKNLRDQDEAAERLRRAQQDARAGFQADRQRLVDEETLRRQGAFDDQLAALDQETRLVQTKWQANCQDIALESDRPLGPEPAVVVAARERWQGNLQSEKERLDFARQWAACLRESVHSLPSRLLGYVNLVAATTTGLAADEHFGDATAGTLQFDLLILDGAQEITESEFQNVARRARRWVLVGEPAPRRDHPQRTPRTAERPATRARRQAAPAPVRSPLIFQRLWDQLHGDPRRLPYRWRHDDSRLSCQLRPLSEGQRLFLTSERVADRPEIELRIAAPPGREPFLAEVIFPPSMSVAEAKAYIFHEIAELPVSASGHGFRWAEDAERVLLRVSDRQALDALPVPLSNGVCERVAPGSACHTCSIEFNRRAGWSLPQAEAWAEQHLGVRDSGRTIRLVTSHRMRPALATFINDVLFNGDGLAPSGEEGSTAPAVAFVPVPPLAPERRSGRGETGTRAQLARTGAGLETDLSDVPHGDRLPAELRAALPRQGTVNYMEALTLVHALERSQAGADAGLATPHVAVLALSAAQADLIRLLLALSPLLAGRTGASVDVPAAVAEHEFDTVFISLTRSHAHRAVPFGDDPTALALALTRARRRLVLFGDVGTLVRRAQWTGLVDHRDDDSAARERDLVAHLLDYLHGHGPHPEAFTLAEGSTT